MPEAGDAMDAERQRGRMTWRPAMVWGGAAVIAAAALLGIADPLQARAAAVAGVCLVLWLGEVVPPFVPTFLLLAAVPLVMPGAPYRVDAVMRWMADPVLVLFLGGMVLAVAAQRHGIDLGISGLALRWSGGHRLRLLALVMGVTATLSMWISNTAAAVVMLTVVGPMIATLPAGDRLRPALLVAIAVAANLGGMATPIGSPPNAIAVAALADRHPLGLLGWMAFGLPCMVILLLVGFGLLTLRYGLRAGQDLIQVTPAAPIAGARAWLVMGVFAAMVLGWFAEPWLGVPPAVVAGLGVTVVFATGLLRGPDLARIDWSTLALIAGGLALGRLLQESGCVAAAAGTVDWPALPPPLRLALLVLIAAFMSSVMSNTATATMLIPLAQAIDPLPSAPVLVALGCALGMPFPISTPPNALVYARGLRTGDLLLPGAVFIALGALLAALGSLLYS